MKQDKMDSSLYEEWLRNTRRLSDSSIYVYKIAVESFLKKDPTIDEIEDYNQLIIQKAIHKRATYNYDALKSFIKYKFQNNSKLKKELLSKLIKPPVRHDLIRERKHLPTELILDIINALQPKHRILALTQYLTGLRAGDMLGVQRGNIIIEQYEDKEILKIVALGKGKKRNVVYVHNEILKEMILDYISNNYTHDNYYFLEPGQMKGREGDPSNFHSFKKSNYHRYWLDLKYALNIYGVDKKDFATHDFRRCFARKVWESEKDIYVLQSLLNHTDPKNTLRYLAQSGLKNIDYHKKFQT